jgi:hypothetical protein
MKAGRTPAIVAGLLLLQLALAGLLLRATPSQAFFLGRPVGGECAFHRLTGQPCPTCGMTRSVVLTLHGRIGAALRLNPAGPIWVLAVVATALALLRFAWRQRQPGASEAAPDKRRVVIVTTAQGALLLFVLFSHWVYALLARG